MSACQINDRIVFRTWIIFHDSYVKGVYCMIKSSQCRVVVDAPDVIQTIQVTQRNVAVFI